MFAFGKPNFRLSGQKLFCDFKNPFKILAEAEPRLWRGEATIAQNPNSENWRCLLVKIRTFFNENPDAEFWNPIARAGKKEGGWGEGIFARPRFRRFFFRRNFLYFALRNAPQEKEVLPLPHPIRARATTRNSLISFD